MVREKSRTINVIFINAFIAVIGGVIEFGFQKKMELYGVGFGFAILGLVVESIWIYSDQRKVYKGLSEKVLRLGDDYEIVNSPVGFRDYLTDVCNTIGNRRGYAFTTQQYTEILAKFLNFTNGFTSTWTIDINLEYMSSTYQSKQKLPKSIKTRTLLLSKNDLNHQYTNNRENFDNFIAWHRDAGVKLLWIEKDEVKRILVERCDGLTYEQLNEILPMYEDFVFFTDGSILFYDTLDRLPDGRAVPDENTAYNIVLKRYDDLACSQDLLWRQTSKYVDCIRNLTGATLLTSIDDIAEVLNRLG